MNAHRTSSIILMDRKSSLWYNLKTFVIINCLYHNCSSIFKVKVECDEWKSREIENVKIKVSQSCQFISFFICKLIHFIFISPKHQIKNGFMHAKEETNWFSPFTDRENESALSEEFSCNNYGIMNSHTEWINPRIYSDAIIILTILGDRAKEWNE